MVANAPRGKMSPSQFPAFGVIAIGTLVAFGVSGCGTGAEPASGEADIAIPSATVSSEGAGGFDADSPCLLLSTDQVTALLGEAPAGKEVYITGSTIEACHFGDIGVLGVQVAQVPAGEWANALPGMYEAVVSLPEGSVDPSILEQFEEAADILNAGGSIESDKACEYFSYMLEASGQPAGISLSSSYIPDAESAIALSVQQCIDGVYSSILVGRADVAEHPQLVNTVQGLIANLG